MRNPAFWHALLVQEGSAANAARGEVSLAPLLQCRSDDLQHLSPVFEDLPVLKSQDLDFELSKEPFAAVVSFDLQQVGVHGSIEFDNNAAFRTIKVDCVRTYAVLAAKLFPVQF